MGVVWRYSSVILKMWSGWNRWHDIYWYLWSNCYLSQSRLSNTLVHIHPAWLHVADDQGNSLLAHKTFWSIVSLTSSFGWAWHRSFTLSRVIEFSGVILLSSLLHTSDLMGHVLLTDSSFLIMGNCLLTSIYYVIYLYVHNYSHTHSK